MPSLRDIRRRITSVKKTQQITRAMRMVAGAKLRRAEQAVIAARPYTDQMRDALAEVARAQRDAEHPLLVPRAQVRSTEVLVVSSDRGLCGAFNANVVKHADRLVRERERAGQGVAISCAGRKAAEFFRKRRPAAMRSIHFHEGWVRYANAVELAREVAGRYVAGESDEVLLVYNEFVNALTQKPREVRLLPFAPPAAAGGEAAAVLPVAIEPSPAGLLAVLVPKAVEVEVYRALLENQSGEHAARMTAMESATRNTEELISSLTLKFNRARQAAITKELVEIVSGAEAL
jgi:F-type H+-transporting ATPase subunit gamma